MSRDRTHQAAPPHRHSDPLRIRASDIIPGGSSTGSKRPYALYGSHEFDANLPTHYLRAEGCTLVADDARQYIDCSMALGAVAIGYADPEVTHAVQQAAAAGTVTGLPHRLEVDVAERLAEVVPSGEQVRFLRTGAEATAAAIRLARVATSRIHVLACGYFGWLDWSNDALGVPEDVRRHVTTIGFNDIASLEDAVTRHGSDIAAVIIEPLVHGIASREWLLAARDACDRIGAVLVFDEIKTAFRIRTGGVQELHDVLPDLTTVGKAFANGYPLAAVVGRAAIMQEAVRTWISSTAAAESTGLAAARAVLEWHDRTDVPGRILSAGLEMQAAISEVLREYPQVGVRIAGPPQMFRLVADREEQLDAFVAEGAMAGVLFKRGAYQFPSLAHDTEIIDRIGQLTRATCLSIMEHPR